MNKVNHKLSRELTEKETQAVEEAAKILEKGFERAMYASVVTADKMDDSVPYGVAFSFNIKR